ncbi:MAG: ABC transporter permease [Myxococcales bacterium FL481]|nr:MAG: ABC transporter permease [Myxococcales bacterium FL481]
MTERYSPLVELTKSRVREVLREPGFVFWIFGFPVMMAIGLGLAFREREPDKPTVAVVDGASWLADALTDSDRVEAEVVAADEAASRLRTAKVEIVVQAEGAAESGVSYRYDPSRVEARLARAEVDQVLQLAAGRRDALATVDDPVSEKGSRYIDFLLPGLLGLNLMGSSMWGIGYTIVVARKRKLLRRFAATPMRRSHFLLGYLGSRLVFLLLELVGLVGLGFWAFGVTIHGSPLALAIVAFAGAACFASIGLLIAARVRSVEAANGWMNFIMMPMWILSGTFFAASRFPDVMQPFLKVLPLTAVNDALRGIVNEAAPLWSLWPELAVMGVWTVVPFGLALRWFRWQ